MTESVVRMITEERKRQDAQWGGADHDDTHLMTDWIEYIEKQIESIERAIFIDGSIASEAEYESRMVKIAAIAVAAIRSRQRIRVRRERGEHK